MHPVPSTLIRSHTCCSPSGQALPTKRHDHPSTSPPSMGRVRFASLCSRLPTISLLILVLVVHDTKASMWGCTNGKLVSSSPPKGLRSLEGQHAPPTLRTLSTMPGMHNGAFLSCLVSLECTLWEGFFWRMPKQAYTVPCRASHPLGQDDQVLCTCRGISFG